MGGSTDSLEFVFKVGQALADALGILACVQKVIHAGAIALVVIVTVSHPDVSLGLAREESQANCRRGSLMIPHSRRLLAVILHVHPGLGVRMWNSSIGTPRFQCFILMNLS